MRHVNPGPSFLLFLYSVIQQDVTGRLILAVSSLHFLQLNSSAVEEPQDLVKERHFFTALLKTQAPNDAHEQSLPLPFRKAMDH